MELTQHLQHRWALEQVEQALGVWEVEEVMGFQIGVLELRTAGAALVEGAGVMALVVVVVMEVVEWLGLGVVDWWRLWHAPFWIGTDA